MDKNKNSEVKDTRKVYVIVSGVGHNESKVKAFLAGSEVKLEIPFFEPIELPYITVKGLIEAGADVFGKVRGQEAVSIKLDEQFIKRREKQVLINNANDKKLKEKKAAEIARADRRKNKGVKNEKHNKELAIVTK